MCNGCRPDDFTFPKFKSASNSDMGKHVIGRKECNLHIVSAFTRSNLFAPPS